MLWEGIGGNQKPQKWTKTFKTKKTSTQKNKKSRGGEILSKNETSRQRNWNQNLFIRIETLNKMSQKGKTEDWDRKYRITDHTDDPKSKTQFLADLLI